ncbi:MAG: hypothetical protein WAX07_02840 [Candidatus Altiarchaeia archaeon]
MAEEKDWSGEKTRCGIVKAMKEAAPMSRELCLVCKGGRMLCGRESCPLLQKIRIQEPIEKKLSTDMFGPAPSIFVGWKSYPDVFVGPMAAIDPEKATILDDPSKWYGLGFDDIIQLRLSLCARRSSRTFPTGRISSRRRRKSRFL